MRGPGAGAVHCAPWVDDAAAVAYRWQDALISPLHDAGQVHGERCEGRPAVGHGAAAAAGPTRRGPRAAAHPCRAGVPSVSMSPWTTHYPMQPGLGVSKRV